MFLRVGRPDFYLVRRIQGHVYGVQVFLDDVCAFSMIGLFRVFLYVGNGFVARQHAGDFEERGLHDRVDSAAHAGFFGNIDTVDDVELKFFVYDFLLDLLRKLIPNLVCRVRAVQKEGATIFGVLEHVDLFQERELVACNKVSLGNEIRLANLLWSKAQVAYRVSAGLLGIVFEIPLCPVARLVADDFDRVLVGADRAV